VCALFPVPTPSNLWTKFQNPTLNRYKNSTSCQNLRLCSTKKKSAIFISIGFWPDARWIVHSRKAESSGPPCHPKGLWVLARCSYLKILGGCRCDPSARFVQGTSSRGGRVVGSWRTCRCIDTGPRGQLILKYLDVVYESNPNWESVKAVSFLRIERYPWRIIRICWFSAAYLFISPTNSLARTHCLQMLADLYFFEQSISTGATIACIPYLEPETNTPQSPGIKPVLPITLFSVKILAVLHMTRWPRGILNLNFVKCSTLKLQILNCIALSFQLQVPLNP
jgi:hypothetical protein